MRRNSSGRDIFPNFGDPFADFAGFGGHRSLASSFFGGRDPFDDPFFTRPFGGMFESGIIGSSANPFADMQQSSFFNQQPPQHQNFRGPIIEELNSDDEKIEADKQKTGISRKHGRSISEPYVEDPDEVEERRNKHLMQYRNTRSNNVQPRPQAQSFTFQSSSVTYGGANGAYYTSSKTRRSGSDGVTIEESKEADTATRQANHRVSRALHNKGHTVERNLKSDGRVDMMQTLHNLNEGELAGFDEAWNGKARTHLPGWPGSSTGMNYIGAGTSGQNMQAHQGGWALPPAEHAQHLRGVGPDPRDGSGRPSNQSSRRMPGQRRE